MGSRQLGLDQPYLQSRGLFLKLTGKEDLISRYFVETNPNGRVSVLAEQSPPEFVGWVELLRDPTPARGKVLGLARTRPNLRLDQVLRPLDGRLRHGVKRFTNCCTFSPTVGTTSMRVRSASARKSLSFMVAAKPARRILSGSAGTPGGAIGPPEHLLADDQLDRLLVVRVLDVVPDLRDAELGQLGIRLEADLHQDVDGLVRGPSPAAATSGSPNRGRTCRRPRRAPWRARCRRCPCSPRPGRTCAPAVFLCMLT